MGQEQAMRMTANVIRVLGVISRAGEAYGAQICRETGLPSGTVHPMVHKMTSTGWLARRDEQGSHTELGRVPRRYYRTTKEGELAIGAARSGGTRLTSGTVRELIKALKKLPPDLPVTAGEGLIRVVQERQAGEEELMVMIAGVTGRHVMLMAE